MLPIVVEQPRSEQEEPLNLLPMASEWFTADAHFEALAKSTPKTFQASLMRETQNQYQIVFSKRLPFVRLQKYVPLLLFESSRLTQTKEIWRIEAGEEEEDQEAVETTQMMISVSRPTKKHHMSVGRSLINLNPPKIRYSIFQQKNLRLSDLEKSLYDGRW